jgi:hypothetical protein
VVEPVLGDIQRRGRCAVISPLPTSRPHGDASLFQGTSDRARRHAQLRSYRICRLSLGVESRGLIHLIALERPAIPLRDAMTSDMAKDRRPIHPERRCQLLHWDAPTVGGNQHGYFVGCKASLHRQRLNQRVGRLNRRLAGTLP